MTSAVRARPLVVPRSRTAALLAVAAISAIVGIAVSAAVVRDTWAVDADRNLQAARDLVAGRFGVDHGYVYSPLAAALTVPWTWLPQPLAIAGWFAGRLALLLAGVAVATRGWSFVDRVLAAVAVATFVPVSYDLLLGNVSIPIAAAVAIVAWRRDEWRAGLLLGLVLATVPKPQLVPVLAWMLVFRRRALVGALAAAALSTLAAAAFLGVGPYEQWLGVLRSVDYLSTPMYGNRSLFAALPQPAAGIAAVVALAATVAAFVTGPLAALTAAIALGMLVAPYTLAYAPVLALVVARPLADRRPAAALALALSGSIAVIVALPAWLFGLIAAALPVRGDPEDPDLTTTSTQTFASTTVPTSARTGP